MTNCDQPCQALRDSNSPFVVTDRARSWGNRSAIRAAGVSSFGIGGTNVHVVVAQPPSCEHMATGESLHLIQQVVENLLEHLEQHPDIELADRGYTLHYGRQQWSVRKVVVTSYMRPLKDGLRQSSKLIVPNDDDSTNAVIVLAMSWQQGEALDWTIFYKGERRRRLTLPFYPLIATVI